MKRLLCIRLPHWPLQRLVVAQPELRGRVVVLHARDPRRGLCVAACSHRAWQQGIRPGMPLAEALALDKALALGEWARHAPGADDASAARRRDGAADQAPTADLPHRQTGGPATADTLSLVGALTEEAAQDCRQTPHIAAHDASADATALLQLASRCERFSPLVGFEPRDDAAQTGPLPPPRSDCLYLDVTHLETYFGDDVQLARQVTTDFSRLGYRVRVALADTLGGAWACARFTSQHTVVENAFSPGGVPGSSGSSFRVVPPGTTIQALQALPVEALRLPPDVLSLLRQLGIVQLAQLAALPRASLLSRFGPVLLQRWDQACGHLDEPMVAHHPEPLLHVSRALEYPVTDRAAIESLLRELLTRLTRLLQARGEGVLQGVCRLTCGHGSQDAPGCSPALSSLVALPLGLYQPTACAEHLQHLWHMQLERCLLPGPVQRMDLEVTGTASLERRQRVLFADSRRADPYQLAQLLDRLSSRLGASNVVRAYLQAEAQPELAYTYLPWTGVGARRASATRRAVSRSRDSAHRAAPPGRHARRRLIRPLHLRSPPLPVHILALAPDGPPLQLFFGRRAFRVVRAWGPERLETGWWRGRSLRRDYYRLETACGHWLWVFRQLRDNRWFLHGMFG